MWSGLQVEGILAWEGQNGKISEGTVVFVRSVLGCLTKHLLVERAETHLGTNCIVATTG
ncbi:MAG TPA: hypothetical protein V6D10_09845 [Trichocoleus sp.]